MMWRGPPVSERSVVGRGRDRERHYSSDLAIAEPRRQLYNRRLSMDVGYPRYPPPSAHPYYEWDESYDSTSSINQRRDDRTRAAPSFYDKVEKKHGASSISFDNARSKLFAQLGQAEGFYQTFLDEFDSEVSSIKKYANDEILRQLWSRRIGDPASRRDSVTSEDLVTEWEKQSKKPLEKFEIQASKVKLRLYKAATADIAVPKSAKDESNMDSAKLLQDKIETAGEGIRKLLRKVYRSREYCCELLKELQQLKDLVDPAKSQSHDDEHGHGLDGADDSYDQPSGDYPDQNEVVY